MAQFDIYAFTPGGGVRLVVDLQNALLEGLATRLVAPLYPLKSNEPTFLRLNPRVQVEGDDYYIAIQEMSAIRLNALGKKIASVGAHRDQIIAAIDFLTTGV